MKFSRLMSPALIACLAIFITASVLFGVVTRKLEAHLIKKPIEGPQKVRSIPTQTANWKQVGTDHQEEAEVELVLGTKNYLTRRYARTTPDKPPMVLELHLAYYTGMIDTVPHVPERCLVGGGMQITGGTVNAKVPLPTLVRSPDPDVPKELGAIERARIVTPGSPRNGQRVRLPAGISDLTLRCTEFQAPGESEKLIAGYFFIANGGIAASAEDVRRLAFDLRSDYAYYLKVQVSTTMVEDAHALADAAGDLLSELLPEIMTCVPDWVQVHLGEYPPDNPRRKEND